MVAAQAVDRAGRNSGNGSDGGSVTRTQGTASLGAQGTAGREECEVAF